MGSKLTAALICTSIIAAAETVPVPKVTVLPVSANSRPFMGADHLIEPMDLAKSGYTEAEYLVSGAANVYDWNADGSLTVKTPNAPYTGKILVRFPADRAKFSGTVVVELENAARRFDWGMMWGYLHEYLMEHGDAWVGISMPANVAGLQKFDSSRYTALSFANPNPTEVCAAAAGGRGKQGPPAPSATEDGLRWDFFSQVAAALKSTDKSSPFAGSGVDRVYMTTQVGDIETYINAIHSHAVLANGKPAYDGYIIKNPTAPARISNCGAAIPRGDARASIKDINVPVIAVVAQGEVMNAMPYHKPDSDAAAGRYREYDIASAAHIDRFAYATGFPSFADQIAAVGSAQGTPEWPFNAMCDPPIPLSENPLLKYSYDAALMNLDGWSRKGTAPPKEQPLTVTADPNVFPTGGVRSPWVDVPVAAYATTSPGPGTCAELGHALPFSADRLKQMYPTPQDYAKKVSVDVDTLVKAHWFTESDGKKMKSELIAAFGK